MQDANLANFLHERNRKTKILQVSCVHNKILLISCTGETARQKSCKLLAPVYVQDKKNLANYLHWRKHKTKILQISYNGEKAIKTGTL